TPAPYSVPVSFVHATNKISRSDGGSWVDDGLVAGQTITVSGTANNNAVYKILSVTKTTLTLTTDLTVKDEGLMFARFAPFAPTGDDEDTFTVNQLQTMDVAAGHTLTLDGQAESDSYIINTTGSQGAGRNYVINVLDTGAPDDGVDVASVYGADSTLN